MELDSRKKFLLIGGIIFIILLALIIFFGLSQKNTPPNSSSSSGGMLSNSNGNNAPTSYPSNTGGKFPDQAPTARVTSGNGKILVIDNPKNTNSYKESYNNFTKTGTDLSQNRQWSQFADNKNLLIALDQIENGLELSINKNLKPILDQYDYDLTKCSSSEKNDFGIQLTIKYIPGYPEEEISAARRFLREWEPSMLKDLHTVIFPNLNFSDELLNQSLNFGDGKYRFAEVSLPDGKKGSINYGIVGNYIVFTSSKDCLDKTSNDLITPEQ